MTQSNSPQKDQLSVDVKNLTKRFGGFTAVNSVDFRIPRGAIFGFLGPNGAGKSTTIRMLLGIITPSDGQGTVLGLDILTRSEQIRARVGYMSQKFSLYEDLTVMENLDFFAGVFNLKNNERRQKIREIIDLARLKGSEGALASSLPRGLRQRLAFGVSLIHDPEIVFLDEPTGGVDPSLRRYFWDVIANLSRQGKTIMVTTHYMDEVERCHQICFIYGGEIIARGSPSQLKREQIKGVTYECETEDRVGTINRLKEIPGVISPFPAGDKIRFIYGSEDPAPLEEAVREKQCGKIRRTSPNLEDVFVYLTATSDSNKKETNEQTSGDN